MKSHGVISSPHEQNDCHFTDDKFKHIFINQKFYILIWISLKFVPVGPIVNNASEDGLDNGLALNRWQAIILTNADLIHWCIYVALGGDELRKFSIYTSTRISSAPYISPERQGRLSWIAHKPYKFIDNKADILNHSVKSAISNHWK